MRPPYLRTSLLGHRTFPMTLTKAPCSPLAPLPRMIRTFPIATVPLRTCRKWMWNHARYPRAAVHLPHDRQMSPDDDQMLLNNTLYLHRNSMETTTSSHVTKTGHMNTSMTNSMLCLICNLPSSTLTILPFSLTTNMHESYLLPLGLTGSELANGL